MGSRSSAGRTLGVTVLAELPPAQQEAAYLQVLREELEGSFELFARYFFRVRKGTRFVFSDHHRIICEDLLAMWRGEVQNLITNMPPRYSKTELCVILFVAWCYVRNPRCEFIHLSYSLPLAMENSDAIREVIKSHEFQLLWPHIQVRPNKDSKQAWETVQGGKFYATQAGGSVTGFGAGRLDEYDEQTGGFTFAGCILIDDPLKPDDARHDTLRKAVNRRWTETIQSRRNSPRTPVHCVMQRIHLDDFSATLAQDPDFANPPGGAERMRHRKLPALIDEDLPTERALWPAKHTVQALKLMKYKRNDRGQDNPLAGETFSGQYQQDPTPAGGGIVREAWWRYYANLEEVKRRCTWFIITADTAYTSDTANDPSSIQFWGAEGKKRLYLLDAIHGWWEFPDLVKEMIGFWDAHREAKQLYIENKASGPSLAQTIRRQRTHELQRSNAKVVLWVPKHYRYPDDKVGRMKEWSHQVHAGCIWLPGEGAWPSHKTVEAASFVDEHSAFTADDTHLHDDRCDGATMAGSVWTKKGGGVRTGPPPV